MSKRYSGLDFLKFVSNIGIILHHYQQVTHYSFNYYLDFYYGFFYWGYLVELFFCISGFLAVRYIGRIREGIEFDKYVIHRFKRFVPAILVCTVSGTIVLYIYHIVVPVELWASWGNYYHEKSDLWKILTNTLCMNFGGVVNPQNGYVGGVTWTISVLIICDIVLYVIVKLADKIKKADTTIYIGMVLLGIAIQEYGINLPFINNYVARGYCAFFAGLLLGIYINKINGYRVKTWIRAILLIVLTIATLFSTGQEYLLAVMVYPLLISIFTDTGIEKVFSRWNCWSSLGKIGFEMYIWHPVILTAWLILTYVLGINPYTHGFCQMLIFAMLCIVIGAFTYLFIEKPLGKLVNKIG